MSRITQYKLPRMMLIIICIAIMCFGLLFVALAFAQRDYAATEGTILSKHCLPDAQKKDRSCGVTVKYIAEGQTYRNSATAYWTENVGDPITLYYDRQNPDNVTTNSFSPFGYFLGGALFIGFGAALIYILRSRKDKRLMSSYGYGMIFDND